MKTPRTLIVLTGLGALALLARPARADFVIRALDSTAASGGTGSFDVDLTDTDAPGSTPYQVAGFSFGPSVPSTSGVSFTSVDPVGASGFCSQFGKNRVLPHIW